MRRLANLPLDIFKQFVLGLAIFTLSLLKQSLISNALCFQVILVYCTLGGINECKCTFCIKPAFYVEQDLMLNEETD